jgi:hypothetical protein
VDETRGFGENHRFIVTDNLSHSINIVVGRILNRWQKNQAGSGCRLGPLMHLIVYNSGFWAFLGAKITLFLVLYFTA